MRNRLKNINFYLTSFATGSGVDNLVDSGTFVVKDTTVNGFSLTNGDQVFYVIANADQTLKREIFRITNVNIATKTLTFDKRISPNGKQTHTEDDLVQINDFAELFNYMALHIDDVWHTEVTTGRNVKFYGGILRYADSNVTVSDQTFTLNPNATNYIILDFSDGDVKVVTSLPSQYYLFATGVTNGTDVLSLTDNRATFVGFDTSVVTPSISVGNTTTLAAGSSATVTNSGTSLAPVLNFGIPKGATGDIATAPEGAAQTVNDNILPEGSSVVTTNDTTYIRVTRTNGTYAEYTLTGIREYDANGNLLTEQIITGVFGAQAITYAATSGSVDKTTGIYTVDGEIAYRNLPNVFSEGQVFEKTAAFNGLVLFPYYTNTANTSIFNAVNGSKQKFTFSDSGSHTLVFQNLRAGGNYVFSVVVSGGSATLVKASTFTDCDTITTMYTIGTTTYPLRLAVGIHLFVAEAFSTGIHVSYIGTSQPA